MSEPTSSAAVSGPLMGLRVLDLSRVVAGPFGTQILSDLGAEVVRVVPPGGGQPVAAADAPLGRTEAFDWALNRNKQTIELDLRSPGGHARFVELAASADVVYDNFRPGVTGRLGIDHASLSQLHPTIITCSISGFAPDSAWADLPAYDAVVQAASGAMHTTGGATRDSEPARLGLPIGDIAGGMYAAIGIIGALIERDRSGRGQAITLSLMDCQLALSTYRLPQRLDSHIDVVADQHRGGAGSTPYGPFRCSDGAWMTIGVAQQHWRGATRALELDELTDDRRFNSEPARIAHQDELDAVVRARFAERPAPDWGRRLREAGVPSGQVNTLRQALTLDHVAARGMITTVADAHGRSAHVVADPLGHRRVDRAPSPPIHGDTFGWASERGTTPPTRPDEHETGARPLAGVRVIELDGEEPSKAIAGQILADLGAEVVLIERPAPNREAPASDRAVTPAEALRWGLHRGKRSVTADLKSDEGRELALALIDRSDVMIDNYRPGVLARLGIGPDVTMERNPTLVSLSVTAFGHVGPLASSPAYDVNIQAMGGTMGITGNGTDDVPLRWGYPIGGLAGALYGAVGALAGLLRAGREQRGTRIDLSLLDCQLALQSYRVPQTLDLGIGFRPEPHTGGSGARPYGPFRTADDRWFVLAITEIFWQRFCEAAGHRELAQEPRFTTEDDRTAHAAEIDDAVAAIMRERTAGEWEQVFLAHRLPGAAVRTLEEAATLPALGKGMLRGIVDEAGRELHLAAFPVQMSRSVVGRYLPAPIRGADARAVREALHVGR